MAWSWNPLTNFNAFGMGGGNKKTTGSYTPIPYSGARPPSVDANGTNYLRGTQAETQDIIQKRARGEDVGYSPEWLSSSQALIKSNLDRALADRTRTTAGSLSASGLSGNPRAYEATTGRAQRDYSTDLSDSMNALTIADMERKSQERDVNTSRLQALNAGNFGQENAGANFDLQKWQAENGQALSAAGLDSSNYFNQANLNEKALSDVGQGVGMAAGMAAGVPPPMTFAATSALMQPSGQGIGPSASALGGQYSLKQSPEYSRLMRLQA